MTPDPLQKTADPTQASAPVLAGRRRLLRGGLASAPVLLSLTSRPVTATTCTQASSHASVNLSRPDRIYSCGGKKPDWWKQTANRTQWPSQYRPVATTGTPSYPATTFNEVFGSQSGYAGQSLLNILDSTSTTNDIALAKHCIAALLNAATGRTPSDVLSEVMAKNIWASFVGLGYYEPTAGIKWYPTYSIPTSPSGGLLAWMQTTMPA